MDPLPQTPQLRWGSWIAALLALGAGACGPTPPPPPARPRPPAQRRSTPRVRVGAILRLARAGRLSLIQRPDGSLGLDARVPRRHQSQGWQRALDTQGNAFRVAPDGRIVADGEPRRHRQPASVENVAYWAAQAIALLARPPTRRQGLVLSAEILDLPASDPSVRAAHTWFCRLFGKLGIKGEVRRRLYGRLVAVSHRRGSGVEVRNHVFPFALHVPLGWSILAGAVPTRSPARARPRPQPAHPGSGGRRPPRRLRAAPRARTGGPTGPVSPARTALVLAIPADAAGARHAANLVWITQRAPTSQSLGSWTHQTLAQIPGTRAADAVRPLPLPKIPGVTAALSYAVGPIHRGGRVFHSIQVFFFAAGAAHHVSLYFARQQVAPALSPLLARVLSSFHPGAAPDPCR